MRDAVAAVAGGVGGLRVFDGVEGQPRAAVTGGVKVQLEPGCLEGGGVVVEHAGVK